MPAWLGKILGFEDEERNLERKRVLGRVGLTLFRWLCITRPKYSEH